MSLHLTSLGPPTRILPDEEGPTMALLPQKVQKNCTLPSASCKLLQSNNRKYPLPECNSVVWKLQCTRRKGLGLGVGEDSPQLDSIYDSQVQMMVCRINEDLNVTIFKLLCSLGKFA